MATGIGAGFAKEVQYLKGYSSDPLEPLASIDPLRWNRPAFVENYFRVPFGP
jgi:hypothetical protein